MGMIYKMLLWRGAREMQAIQIYFNAQTKSTQTTPELLTHK